MKHVISKGLFTALVLTGAGVIPLGAQTTSTVASATDSATTIAESISPAPEPGRWQLFWINRVKEFIAENATLDPGTRYIVFVGDSITQQFKLKEYFPGLPVLNRGIGSDGSCDFPGGRNVYRGVTRRLKESVFDCRPSHVFFMLGTNDVGVTSIPLEYWFGAYKYYVERTREAFPDVKIILMTCPPCGDPYVRKQTLNPRLLEWNALLRKYAADQWYRLIDLHSLLVDKDGLLPSDLTTDGLHINKAGYDRWAEAVRRILHEDGVMKSTPDAKQE